MNSFKVPANDLKLSFEVRSFFQQMMVFQLDNKFHDFIKTEDSSLPSQNQTVGPYAKPVS
jgi:hypothetical protein